MATARRLYFLRIFRCYSLRQYRLIRLRFQIPFECVECTIRGFLTAGNFYLVHQIDCQRLFFRLFFHEPLHKVPGSPVFFCHAHFHNPVHTGCILHFRFKYFLKTIVHTGGRRSGSGIVVNTTFAPRFKIYSKIFII